MNYEASAYGDYNEYKEEQFHDEDAVPIVVRPGQR
jgi:hypothetical protein